MKTTTGKGLIEVDATTLHNWLATGEAQLIDVREPAEYAGEHIAEAQALPLSKFDPAQVSQTPGKKIVLCCQSSNRSSQAGQRLLASGIPQVWHLRGGLQAWKDAGHATIRNLHAPISLQRQVQMTAGSLVLVGTLLGAFVSPWWLVLSGFVGAGLTFAGISGTCGMAMLLARLPYNQRVS